MKTPTLILKAGLIFACTVLSLRAAPIISETFDKPAVPEKWKADASVTVKDGALILTATGGAEIYANSAATMKAGEPALDFTAKPVEIEVRDLDVTGPGISGDGVMVWILSADTQGEGNSTGYLKLRLSDDGTLMLMYGAAGTKEVTIHRLASHLVFPVKSLKVRLSATDFGIKGSDAEREFSGAGKWGAEFNPAVWKGQTPYLQIRSVRRPGEGSAVVKVGALVVSNVP
jgi:hypothetical protein